MFKTIYVLKLRNKKYLNNLIKYHVAFYKVKEQDDAYFLYVNKNDYEKLKKYFDIYGISLVYIKGFQKYINLINEKKIFFICMTLGILYLHMLSNVIFDVKIMSNNDEIITLLQNELDSYGIKKYRKVKSFEEKEIIKNNILNKYKDKLEWLEIERIGTKYNIHVLERIINKEKESNNFQSVIAKKNAVILEIKASSGEIVKKVNDYVNKGDVIISGFITKNDEVKNIVRADGIIYGETWYNIKVELPHTYQRKKYTGSFYHELSLNFFNKRFSLKKIKYNNYEYQENVLLSNTLIPFSLNYSTVYEINNDYIIYDYNEALNKGINIAREKLLERLDKESKILYQKKLKLYEENSKIIVEVFFKVYENITDYIEITGGSDERSN